MSDRRALLIGHWGPEALPGPTHQKVQGLLSRWESTLAPDGRYGFNSLDDRNGTPTALRNPKRSEITAMISDSSVEISDETLLLLYYVGHSRSRGQDDLDLALWYDKASDSKKYLSLSGLLQEISDCGVKKLILVIDSCHAGRARESVYRFADSFYALVATGDSYAFNYVFSEQLLNTLERRPHRNDQRIDRRANGFTYRKLFQVANSGVLRQKPEGKTEPSQKPQSYGDLGDELLVKAPAKIPEGFNPFVSSRTIYGRVFCALNVIKENELDRSDLISVLRSRDEFLLQSSDDTGVSRYVGVERCGNYLDFLVQCELVRSQGQSLSLTEAGEMACEEDQYNLRILSAIEEFVLPDGVSIDFLDETVKELLDDLVPATPSNIGQRILMKGTYFEVDEVVKLGLAVLPSTGRFMKGTADALFPGEIKID